MIKYGIVSDRNCQYQLIIEKLQNYLDYKENEIVIDIIPKELKKILRKGIYVDYWIAISDKIDKLLIKMLKCGISYEYILTFNQLDEISSFKKPIYDLYKNATVCYTVSEEVAPNIINMEEVNYDFVRFRNLSLVINQIKENNICGNIAEVGVFKGDFARWLNYCLPEKKLYLFDTFEGFDDRDISVENEIGIVDDFSKEMAGFADTSVQYVLSRMKNVDVCEVHKGYFPKSAQGIDDSFCFVSLDTDLYEPIKNGLEFFWPKMQKGGYIFVHDYNSQYCPGVRKAVDEWTQKTGVHVIPICDRYGSCIIVKN